LLNRVMQKCISLALAGGADALDAEVALEAVAALGLAQEEPAPFSLNDGRVDVAAARDSNRSHRLFAGPRRMM
jgi:hypothetical protein